MKLALLLAALSLLSLPWLLAPPVASLSSPEMRAIQAGSEVFQDRKCIKVGTCTEYNAYIDPSVHPCVSYPSQCAVCAGYTGSDEWEYCQLNQPDFDCEWIGTRVNDCGTIHVGTCDPAWHCTNLWDSGTPCTDAPACAPAA